MRPEVPEGLTVKYFHERHLNTAFTYAPKGGRTTARIYRGEEVLVEGYAKCRPDENFNKRIGRDIALGRALKVLEEKT